MQGIHIPGPDEFALAVIKVGDGLEGQVRTFSPITKSELAKEVAAYGFDKWGLEDWLDIQSHHIHTIVFDIEVMKNANVFPKEGSDEGRAEAAPAEGG